MSDSSTNNVSPTAFRKLSVVIPVFNERNTIKEILDRVQSVKTGLETELVVVDDFSTDGTREYLQELEANEPPNMRFAYHPHNRGKGAALRTGFQLATGDLTIVQDADLEYNPDEYPNLIRPLIEGKADIVYGSRFKDGPQSEAWHTFGNQMLTVFSNLFTGYRLTDMETCYKVFPTKTLQGIPLRSDRFGFEPEITAKLARRKLRILEVPISYSRRHYDEGKKINWKDAVAAFAHIIRFRFVD